MPVGSPLRRALLLPLLATLPAAAPAAPAGDGKQPFAFENALMAVAFSRDGSRLAGGCPVGKPRPWLRVWDAATGAVTARFEPAHHVNDVGFSADGKLLWSVSIGGEDHVEAWDIAKEEQVQKIRIPYEGGHYIVRCSLSDDGGLFAWGGLSDRTVSVWDLAGMSEKERLKGIRKMRPRPLPADIVLPGHDEEMWSCRFSPGKEPLLAVGTGKGSAFLWNLKERRILARLEGRGAGICDLAFTPDARRLVTVADDGTVKVWDLEKGGEAASARVAEIRPSDGHGLWPFPAVLSGDGSVAAVRTDQGYACWDVAKAAAIGTLRTDRRGAFALSHDGKRLAAATAVEESGRLVLWDVPALKEIPPGR